MRPRRIRLEAKGGDCSDNIERDLGKGKSLIVIGCICGNWQRIMGEPSQQLEDGDKAVIQSLSLSRL
jgi:hypothetical protein